jgi:hypothetical protein
VWESEAEFPAKTVLQPKTAFKKSSMALDWKPPEPVTINPPPELTNERMTALDAASNAARGVLSSNSGRTRAFFPDNTADKLTLSVAEKSVTVCPAATIAARKVGVSVDSSPNDGFEKNAICAAGKAWKELNTKANSIQASPEARRLGQLVSGVYPGSAQAGMAFIGEE